MSSEEDGETNSNSKVKHRNSNTRSSLDKKENEREEFDRKSQENKNMEESSNFHEPKLEKSKSKKLVGFKNGSRSTTERSQKSMNRTDRQVSENQDHPREEKRNNSNSNEVATPKNYDDEYLLRRRSSSIGYGEGGEGGDEEKGTKYDEDKSKLKRNRSRDGEEESSRKGNGMKEGETKPIRRHSRYGNEKKLFEVGDLVEALFGGKDVYFPGRISRCSKDGTYTVHYDDGDREVHVSPEYIRLRKSSRKTSEPTSKQPKAFKVNDVIEVVDADGTSWEEGRIVTVNENNTYTVEYHDGEIEKLVHGTHIRECSIKPKASIKVIFFVGETIEIQTEEEWNLGTIVRARYDGTYDIRHHLNKTIERRVKTSRLRKYYMVLSKNACVRYKDKSQIWHNGTIDRVNKDGTCNIRHDNDEDIITKNVNRRDIEERLSLWNTAIFHMSLFFKSLRMSSFSLWNNLREDDTVRYVDKNGVWHQGYILQLRPNGNYDIQHESDDEEIAKNVPSWDIKALHPSGVSTWVQSFSTYFEKDLQLNQKVRYLDSRGIWQKGKIVKIHSKNLYDIKNIMDQEKVERKVKRCNIRCSSTAYEAFSNALDTFRTFSVGTNVEYNDNGTWIRAKISKLRANGTYDLEYNFGDKECERKKVAPNDIRAVPLQWFSPELVVGMVVDVKEKTSHVTHLARITKDNMNGNYEVEYEDGEVERKVKQERIKASSSRMRIGVKVEVIIEDQVRGCSVEKGQVAWIHDDDSLTVRMKDDRILSTLQRERVKTIGSFNRTPHSTNREILFFFLGLLVELFVYSWFILGMVVELSEGLKISNALASSGIGDAEYMQLQYASTKNQQCLVNNENLQTLGSLPRLYNLQTNGNRSFTTINSEYLALDRTWLLLLLSINCCLFILFILMIIPFFYRKIRMITSWYITPMDRSRDILQRGIICYLTIAMILISSTSLICYGSILNKFRYFCLWIPSEDYDIGSLALSVNPFQARTHYSTLSENVEGIIGATGINLFRSLTFVHIIEVGRTLWSRILLIFPAVLSTTLFCVKTLASFTILHGIQGLSTIQGDFSMNSNMDGAIFLVLCAHYINGVIIALYMQLKNYDVMLLKYEYIGKIDEDCLEMAENGQYGVRAKQEALVERKNILMRKLGRFRTGIVAWNKLIFLHFLLCILCVAVDFHLQGQMQSSSYGSKAATIDAVITIIWFLLFLLMKFFVSQIKREYPYVFE